ncbi:MAG TPA: DUF308 domain-containing protein [Puia sp.]|jgi:uncharacterized membrane protein HdeD (DUF308 family)|nr:DUF308 domain-containing protein [Puia sp.]
MRKRSSIWILLMAVGVVFLVIGVMAFLHPLSSYVKLAKYAGAGLLINGILLQAVIVVNKRYPQESLWMQIESILDFLFALLLLINPLLSFILLDYLIGIWILLVGILKILAAFSLRRVVRGWRFILLVGMLSVIFGGTLLYSPFVRAEGITWLIGAFGTIMGFLYILDSFYFRKREDTLDMML